MTTTIPLNYLSRDHDLRRPAALYVIATLSIIYGSIGLLGDAFMEFFSWFSPQMRRSQISPLDLCYRVEFYLCALAMLWLLIAAIRVFTSKDRGPLNPWRMLAIYVPVKFALAAGFVLLNCLDHFDPNPVLFRLFFMCAFPVFLAIILCRRSVRAYYAGAARRESATN
jgi:hypothetical protein